MSDSENLHLMLTPHLALESVVGKTNGLHQVVQVAKAHMFLFMKREYITI